MLHDIEVSPYIFAVPKQACMQRIFLCNLCYTERMTWRYLGTNLSLDCFLSLAWSKGRTQFS